MQRAGYDATFARAMVADALGQPHPAAADAAGATKAPAARARPKSDMVGPDPAGNAIRDAGRDIPVLFRIEAPRVMLLQGLLSEAECDAMVALSRDRMQRSSVVNPATGDENVHEARTSTGAMFQVGEHPLLEVLEARIAAVTGVPMEHGEGFQVLNYKPGAEYQPHYDYFNPKNPGEARQMAVGGQRVATLVIYLNSTPAGGATTFPRIRAGCGPGQGQCCVFQLQAAGRHAGRPHAARRHAGGVGEKWIATKWLRGSGRTGSEAESDGRPRAVNQASPGIRPARGWRRGCASSPSHPCRSRRRSGPAP